MAFNAFAVDPTNPDVERSAHPGGLSLGMPDGSVRFLNASITDSIWIDMGAPPADGYLNPSSFQIIAAGPKGEAEPQLTTEPTAPEPYMSWKLENCKITSYSVHGADAFDFSQLTTEPTAPQAGEPSAPSISEIVVTKVTDSTSPLLGEVNHSEFTIVKLLDGATPKLFSEDAFVFADAGGGVRLSTDPSNGHSGDGGFADGHSDGGLVIDWLPDSDDGGIIIDFTPGPDDNVGLPAADGLLLPY